MAGHVSAGLKRADLKDLGDPTRTVRVPYAASA
jgi:hypothetical protein